ncbi:MAG: hypothetical protein IJC55_03845 [Clostridia bacterium]|nr:hypothetical protein [Clostridia bacterium]
MLFPPYEEKGMGSAYGGEWQPKKEEDKRFLGTPGEIKETITKKGELFLTKIGEDGRAITERHLTDHRRSWSHTNPHDHIIDWSKGFPYLGDKINYPNSVPEFKQYRGESKMFQITKQKFPQENQFESIRDFKGCVDRGGEVEFNWKGKSYTVAHDHEKICISEGCYLKEGKYYNALSHTEYDISEEWRCDTVDEILEYSVGGDRLRDVVTQIEVEARTL